MSLSPSQVFCHVTMSPGPWSCSDSVCFTEVCSVRCQVGYPRAETLLFSRDVALCHMWFPSWIFATIYIMNGVQPSNIKTHDGGCDQEWSAEIWKAQIWRWSTQEQNLIRRISTKLQGCAVTQHVAFCTHNVMIRWRACWPDNVFWHWWLFLVCHAGQRQK